VSPAGAPSNAANATAAGRRRETPSTGGRNARERILDAAVERIATEGIDGVRIARIAMDARVSTSLVHYHFDSREALLREALVHSFELAGDVRIGQPSGEPRSHADTLAAMIDQCLPYPGAAERDWILWVELWLRAVRRPELRETAARLYARMHEWFASEISAGVESGEFTECDVHALTDRLMALLDGLGIRALVGDPSMPVERARAEVWAVVAAELGLPE
jgi:AcrR family transcriptional regulator